MPIVIKHSDAQRFWVQFRWPMLICWIILTLFFSYAGIGGIAMALFMGAFVTAIVFGIIAPVYWAVTKK